jgi:hypothetical protein
MKGSRMTWYAYDITPIDSGWDYLRTIPETAALIGKHEALGKMQGYSDAVSVKDFLADFENAKVLAKEHGWEGDYRGEPHVFWIPVEGEVTYGFVWKQDNNGTTFIVSPQPLPWVSNL